VTISCDEKKGARRGKEIASGRSGKVTAASFFSGQPNLSPSEPTGKRLVLTVPELRRSLFLSDRAIFLFSFLTGEPRAQWEVI
jgi:hypothetical protein